MRWFKVLALALMASQAVYAEEIHIIGNIEQSIAINPLLKSDPSEADYKIISIPQVELSLKEKNELADRLEKTLHASDEQAPSLLSHATTEQAQLGMSKVPVLDQGQHGSCAVFAVTAGVDALLKKGDYVSQLCLLQLGQYLANKTGELSGWDGGYTSLVFDRMYTYGIINIANQKLYGCGGAKKYPKNRMLGTEMTDTDYLKYSEALSQQTVKATSIERGTKLNQFVTDIKTALKSGNRVLLSVLIPISGSSSLEPNAWHYYFSDTWVLTDDIAKEARNPAVAMGGHMMIITGFDDDAVAMDMTGTRHHGLFKLRNSWGTQVGDWGDFYMSYDYVKTLTAAAEQIN